MLPRQEVTWRDLEADSIRTWFPTRELLAHWGAGYRTIPHIRTWNGLRGYRYGPYTSNYPRIM